MEHRDNETVRNSVIEPRASPLRRRERVFVGCGAGFAGDRPLAAFKLIQRVEELDYLVLECLAERTLADRYRVMVSGGDGYDPRISEWMQLLLPLAVERNICIITNMGAMDPLGAQKKVLEIAESLGLDISVAVAHEVSAAKSGMRFEDGYERITFMFTDVPTKVGASTYLGAAPIVDCLEKYNPNIIITSRLADAALFLAPMVYELGWNWDDLELLAQGALAGHLLECGCQLTGGYFMHPEDKHRNLPLQDLLELSLPYAEVSFDGKVLVGKADGSGGVLNSSTCSEQLLYEVGDPGAYITPDVIIDISDVSFHSLSSCKVLCAGAKPSSLSVPEKLLRLLPKDCGWKGWGEISYGGHKCVERAKAAEFLVKSWMEETYPGSSSHVISYIIGLDSLKASTVDSINSYSKDIQDIRLRMDGLFENMDHAVQFSREFTALYTNGPAGGGGISTGYKKEIILEKQLVPRERILWRTEVKCSEGTGLVKESKKNREYCGPLPWTMMQTASDSYFTDVSTQDTDVSPSPTGEKIPLYHVAHSRAGDKGNDLNFSIIPHFPPDIERLKVILTSQWVKNVVSELLNSSSSLDDEAIGKRDTWVNQHVEVEIYEVKGIHSLNVVVRNILDGGVNCSRRIDRHGKTISDLILCQRVILPP